MKTQHVYKINIYALHSMFMHMQITSWSPGVWRTESEKKKYQVHKHKCGILKDFSLEPVEQ